MRQFCFDANPCANHLGGCQFRVSPAPTTRRGRQPQTWRLCVPRTLVISHWLPTPRQTDSFSPRLEFAQWYTPMSWVCYTPTFACQMVAWRFSSRARNQQFLIRGTEEH